MNLQNVKQKLDKVNRFFAYLEANQEIVSKIDRDSLLASIRELYDACFDEATEAAAPVVKTVQKVEKEPVKTTPEPKEKTDEEPTTKKKRPKLVFNKTQTTSTSQEPSTPDQPKEATPEPPKAETPKQPTKKEEPVEETPKEESKKETGTDGFNEDYEELFMFKAATDLSQKLSEAPLKDLNKALGLNEKFLYINELFGGDVAKFQASIKVLNDGKDFDIARQHMESALIEQYEWMKKIRKTFNIS